jgi:hypothetical protein
MKFENSTIIEEVPKMLRIGSFLSSEKLIFHFLRNFETNTDKHENPHFTGKVH